MERISVNYSIDEFNKNGFKREFFDIIEKNNIPVEKIAIELTESQDSYDFEKVYENMHILSNYNIKFYLDDENVCSRLGFDYLQGYKYSKPVAIEELEQFLEKNNN